MRVLLFVIICFCCFYAPAQVKPEFFPEDVQLDETDGHIKCFCKPGVRNNAPGRGVEFSYSLLSTGTFEPENGTNLTPPFSEFNNWQQLTFGLKIPLILREDFKLLLGYKYHTEIFDFRNFGQDFQPVFQSIDQNPVKQNSYSIIVNKPLDEKNYLLFRGRYLSSGNYTDWMNFDQENAIYNFVGVFVTKPNEDYEWGFGLNVSSSFRRTSAIPFFVYNKTFNQRWGIESVFPAFIYGRYNIDRNHLLLFGMQYNSDSYRLKIENDGQEVYDFAGNHSEVISSVRLERKFSNWVWASFKVGYQTNFSSDFESKIATQETFYVEPTDGMYFNISLFISPPRKDE